GLVGIAAELAARMQGRQDDLESRFVGEFGMRIDRNAATIVTHGDGAVGGELELDARRVPGDRLVHRIVHDLGDEVMEGPLVSAADIHAGAAPHRLQPLENLDILGRVARRRLARKIVEEIRHHAIIENAALPVQAGYGRKMWKPYTIFS